ncbi:MAG: hypothetical protein II065_00690 [Bacteroidaceae bacterium]|nr:hypothetical protein [Bacteroidaceae bacterium]
MSMIKCPECGHDVSTHAPSCPNCGCRIEHNLELCSFCGSYNIKQYKTCIKCGRSLNGDDDKVITFNAPETGVAEKTAASKQEENDNRKIQAAIAAQKVAEEEEAAALQAAAVANQMTETALAEEATEKDAEESAATENTASNNDFSSKEISFSAESNATTQETQEAQPEEPSQQPAEEPSATVTDDEKPADTPSAETEDTTPTNTVAPETAASTQPAEKAEETEKPKKKSHAITWICVSSLIIAGIVGFKVYSNYTAAKHEEEVYSQVIKNPCEANIKQYLDEFPNGAHRNKIYEMNQKLIKSKKDWQKIAESSSAEDFMQFIDTHPHDDLVPSAQAKIDSLAWMKASLNDTEDEYLRYLSTPAKYIGKQKHREEAESALNNINKKKVETADRSKVRSIFRKFFDAICNKDEATLKSTVAAPVKSFLNKPDATENDVVTFMRKVNTSDVSKLSYDMNGFIITKQFVEGKEECGYYTNFTLTQKKESSDRNKSGEKKFTVIARIDTNGKITEFNMKKVEQ